MAKRSARVGAIFAPRRKSGQYLLALGLIASAYETFFPVLARLRA